MYKSINIQIMGDVLLKMTLSDDIDKVSAYHLGGKHMNPSEKPELA
jgi:hypothetical protein